VIAIEGELTNERINLLERERRGGSALQMSAEEAIRRHAQLEGRFCESSAATGRISSRD
jgi:hypothetical protein